LLGLGGNVCGGSCGPAARWCATPVSAASRCSPAPTPATPRPSTTGKWHGKEAELFVREVGMTPMEAILANTRHNAALLGLQGEVGVIAAGKLADIVVWNSNPLADITVLQRPDEISAVDQGRPARRPLRRGLPATAGGTEPRPDVGAGVTYRPGEGRLKPPGLLPLRRIPAAPARLRRSHSPLPSVERRAIRPGGLLTR